MGGVGPPAESKLTSLLAADVGTRFAGSRSRCGDCGSLGRKTAGSLTIALFGAGNISGISLDLLAG